MTARALGTRRNFHFSNFLTANEATSACFLATPLRPSFANHHENRFAPRQ
jgi:hypothetical protein